MGEKKKKKERHGALGGMRQLENCRWVFERKPARPAVDSASALGMLEAPMQRQLPTGDGKVTRLFNRRLSRQGIPRDSSYTTGRLRGRQPRCAHVPSGCCARIPKVTAYMGALCTSREMHADTYDRSDDTEWREAVGPDMSAWTGIKRHSQLM